MNTHPLLKLLKETGLFCMTGIFLVTLVLGIQSSPAAGAEAETSSPRVAFGAGGMFGIYDLQSSESGDDGPGNTKFSQSFGGGLILETMLSSRFGVHTGLWYQHTSYAFYTEGVTMTTENLLMPVYLLTSFNSGPFSLGLLAGLHLAYFTKVDFEFEGSGSDVIKYTNAKQLGVAGGLEFKLAIFRFVDVFVSAVAEKYLTALFDGGGGDSPQYIYGATIRSGILFRTF